MRPAQQARRRRNTRELRGIEIGKTVCRLLYRSRFAEVTRETPSVVSFIFSRVWHVGRNVNQTGNRWIRPRFRNHSAAIAMTDKNARPILLSENALHRGDIFPERRLRLLDDGDVITILDQDVVNAFPAGTICPGAVNQNNIPNARCFVLRKKRATGQQQYQDTERMRDPSYYSRILHRITFKSEKSMRPWLGQHGSAPCRCASVRKLPQRGSTDISQSSGARRSSH